MEIFHVYTMDADSDAKRTIVITFDEVHAKQVIQKTWGGHMDTWRNNICIDRK